MYDKLQELGIPEHEITPSVSIAVSGLLDHIQQLNSSLLKTKEQLESLQNMVDVDLPNPIANRRALMKRLNWSIAMSKRYSGPTSLVVFQITDLKSITNTYGYNSSSRVADYVADFIANNIRDTDYSARISEDRFGTIMYFAESQDVVIKAEKLCSELRISPFRWNNSLINITLSYGVHAITSADDSESALLAATNAMYVNNTKANFEPVNFKT